jgi:hypothetical protein
MRILNAQIAQSEKVWAITAKRIAGSQLSNSRTGSCLI